MCVCVLCDCVCVLMCVRVCVCLVCVCVCLVGMAVYLGVYFVCGVELGDAHNSGWMDVYVCCRDSHNSCRACTDPNQDTQTTSTNQPNNPNNSHLPLLQPIPLSRQGVVTPPLPLPLLLIAHVALWVCGSIVGSCVTCRCGHVRSVESGVGWCVGLLCAIAIVIYVSVGDCVYEQRRPARESL
jgi:hypothetical protein